ncbi:hypothetical protein [Steroidobacter sp.]|uniref:hypothetical protein n=1 Tax=Steroidobacter sp. TaxID=1978227 RepID=UPI001A486E79|nr:hypothetical protein [Steroidobacter sp.]MBL8266027.1 hypothetical protein [Steroidobacter sp.]
MALTFLFIGLSLVCAAYWAGVTSMGLVLMRWPMEALSFFRDKAPPHAVAYLAADFRVMWSFPIWVMAALAIIVSVLFDWSWQRLVIYSCIVVTQGFIGGMLLMIRRRRQFDDTGIHLSKLAVRHPEHNPQRLRKVTHMIFVFWAVAPFVFGQNQSGFVRAAFKVAQVRKDHAVVHLARPWDSRLSGAGLTQGESFLGPGYVRFDDVTVRMRGLGVRVVLEVPSGKPEPRFVSVPKQLIEIE